MLTVMDSIKDEVKNRKVEDLDKFTKSAGAEKIYERREYIILRVKKGYVVYNTKKRFESGHTHLQSFEMSKTLIDNCIRKKRPKTNSLYLLESHIRVTNDSKYKQVLEEILDAKRERSQKDNKYHNRRYCSAC